MRKLMILLALGVGLQATHAAEERQQGHQEPMSIHSHQETQEKTRPRGFERIAQERRKASEFKSEIMADVRAHLAKEISFLNIFKMYRGTAYGLAGICGGAYLAFGAPKFLRSYKYGMSSVTLGCLCLSLSPTTALLKYPLLGLGIASKATVTSVLVLGIGFTLYAISTAGTSGGKK